MSRDDNETMLGRLLRGATNAWSGKKYIEQITCTQCGEWVLKGDTSPCGSHPVLPEADEDTFLVRIGLAKPKPVEKELPQPVQRTDGKPAFKQVNMKQRDERFKRPQEEDPLFEPVQPKRDDGGYVRKVGLQGSRDPFTQAQNRNAIDYEPQVGNKELADYEDDMIFDEPHYELEER